MSNVVIKSVTNEGIELEIMQHPQVHLILKSFKDGIMNVSPGFCDVEILLEAIVSVFQEESNLYGVKQIEFEFNGKHIIVNKNNANVIELIKEYKEYSKEDIIDNNLIKFRSESSKTFWNELINIGYSIEIIRFAQKWAERMQEEILKGEQVDAIAERAACVVAKGKDIPAYMQYCAMVILSDVWHYGDELKMWYCDKYTNYHGEPMKLANCIQEKSI